MTIYLCHRGVCELSILCSWPLLSQRLHLTNLCRLVADSLRLSSLMANFACGTNFAVRAHYGRTTGACIKDHP